MEMIGIGFYTDTDNGRRIERSGLIITIPAVSAQLVLDTFEAERIREREHIFKRYLDTMGVWVVRFAATNLRVALTSRQVSLDSKGRVGLTTAGEHCLNSVREAYSRL